MSNLPETNDDIELLRETCDQKRRELRDTVQSDGDIDAAAKRFALAFNIYQEARAKAVGRTVKRVSAFHIMKNLGQIIGSIRD